MPEHIYTLFIILLFTVAFLYATVGRGGGIILSPVILLMPSSNMKVMAAISVLFIFVNYVSGILGVLSKEINIDPSIDGGICWVLLRE